MKKSIGIVVPFYNTPMWGQTSLYTLCRTLEKYRRDFHIDIIVSDNINYFTGRGKKRNFIRALSEVKYFQREGVKFFQPPEQHKFHGTSLNFAARYFHYCDYLLCWETDIVCFEDDWFETVIGYMEDESIWMTGYENIHFAQGRDSRDWYVMPNPGIYREKVLLEVDKKVLMNQSRIAYYGTNYTLTDKCDSNYMNDVGVFTERRGFSSPSDKCPDGKGNFVRVSPLWYENGQWLFFHMLRESDKQARAFKFEDSYAFLNNENVREHTLFEGGKFAHYWAGTRSWDFLIHQEANLSQINYVRPKIEFEIDMWKEYVPLEIRKSVRPVFSMDRDDEFEYDNLKYIDKHKMGDGSHQELSRETAEWFKKTFMETDYANLL